MLQDRGREVFDVLSLNRANKINHFEITAKDISVLLVNELFGLKEPGFKK